MGGLIWSLSQGIHRAPSVLLPNDADQDMAPPGTIELAEIDPLPGAERKPAFDDRDRDSESHQGCPDVGIRVPLSMPVVSRRRHQPREAGEDVTGHVRVGVLVDGEAGCRMRHVHVTYPVFHPGLCHLGRNSARDVQELGP